MLKAESENGGDLTNNNSENSKAKSPQISIRLKSRKQLEDLEKEAKKAGLSRNKFILQKLTGKDMIAIGDETLNIDELFEIIKVLCDYFADQVPIPKEKQGILTKIMIKLGYEMGG